MLARAGEIPRGRGWTFEPKLDGFRCLVCTHASFLARSRRGWDMTHLLPEFRPLPCLSAFSLTASSSRSTRAGRPDFHRLSSRLLHGRSGITVTLFVFDVLAVEGLPTTMLPYSAHRTLLEELDLESTGCGWSRRSRTERRCSAAVCARGLEGVVAKRQRDPYRPGDRAWVKTKNRATARFAEEREGIGRRPKSTRERAFVRAGRESRRSFPGPL